MNEWNDYLPRQPNMMTTMMMMNVHCFGFGRRAMFTCCIQIIIVFALALHTTQAANDEPTNQHGSHQIDPNDPPQSRGSTSEPQQQPPRTTPRRLATSAAPNATEPSSNITTVVPSNTSLSLNNASTITTISSSNSVTEKSTTVPYNTNLDTDGLTEPTKEPTVKLASKDITTDFPDEDLMTTEEVYSTEVTSDVETRTGLISSAALNATAGSSLNSTAEYATQASSMETTAIPLPVTQAPTEATETPELQTPGDLLPTTYLTEVITQETTTRISITSEQAPVQNTTTQIIPNHSTSANSQRTTIPVTPSMHTDSTTIKETPDHTSSQLTTTVVTTTTQIISTSPSSPSTSSSSTPTGVFIPTKPSNTQQGEDKPTKTPEVRPIPSDRPDSGHPIDGDHNDPDGSHHEGELTKEPSDDNNIPINTGEVMITTMRLNEISIQPMYPPVYVEIILIMDSSEFCKYIDEIQEDLVQVAKTIMPTVLNVRAELLGTNSICGSSTGVIPTTDAASNNSVKVEFYVTVEETYDEETTKTIGEKLEKDPKILIQFLSVKVSEVYIISNGTILNPSHHAVQSVNALPIEISVPLAVVVMIAVAIIGFIAYKAYKIKIARKTYKDRYYFDGTQLHDSMSDTQKLQHTCSPTYNKAAARLNLLIPGMDQGLENPALDLDDEQDQDEALQIYPSHVLSINALAKFYTYIEAIVQEYQSLPDIQSVLRTTQKAPPSPLSPRRLAATLPSHHIFDKLHQYHHHHTILYPIKTEVKVQNLTLSATSSERLNANLVQGYNDYLYGYIACQAPQISADEFWQMVWEQQSKTILLLCAPEEMGLRCIWYWPREMGIQSAQLYGNILVMLQGLVRTDNYVISTLLIKDIQKNLCRTVTHCWFCQWPEMQIPINPRALVVFLLQTRQNYQENPGPVVVQCSDGCGRSGTLITIDICMQSLEDLRSVDIPSTVSRLRQDRGSAVHNREQYSFIYKTVYEYSTMLTASESVETSYVPTHPNTPQSMPLRVMSQ